MPQKAHPTDTIHTEHRARLSRMSQPGFLLNNLQEQ
jgi:hypothetical protein